MRQGLCVGPYPLDRHIQLAVGQGGRERLTGLRLVHRGDGSALGIAQPGIAAAQHQARVEQRQSRATALNGPLLRLKSALADPAMREKAARRYVALATPPDKHN